MEKPNIHASPCITESDVDVQKHPLNWTEKNAVVSQSVSP